MPKPSPEKEETKWADTLHVTCEKGTHWFVKAILTILIAIAFINVWNLSTINPEISALTDSNSSLSLKVDALTWRIYWDEMEQKCKEHWGSFGVDQGTTVMWGDGQGTTTDEHSGICTIGSKTYTDNGNGSWVYQNTQTDILN